MNKLIQRHWVNLKRYTIQEDGVYIESRSLKGYTNKFIKFDDIGFDESIVKQKYNPYLVGFFLLGIIDIVLLVFINKDLIVNSSENLITQVAIGTGLVLILGVIAKIIFQPKKYKIIKGNKSIEFNYFGKKGLHVDYFIEELKAYQRLYMRKRYMAFDEFASIEVQKVRLINLYEDNFIAQSELEDLLSLLDKNIAVRGL